MPAYLIVDVDDLIEYLDAQPFTPDITDVVFKLHNTATLVTGMDGSDNLVAIAVANWENHQRSSHEGVSVQHIFATGRFELFDLSESKFVADALLTKYFPLDSDNTVDELILVSSREDFTTLINRLNLPPHVRVRVWADVEPVSTDTAIFQFFDTILGVKSKNVALYIDFENISISLNEQGYIVDLDVLINALKSRAGTSGQLIHIAAYAPWGQRGSLPPMLDIQGREISDEVPSRLAMESIDPVYSLPGKNSADLRIAKDVLAESSIPGSPEIIIIASGDRDFNDIYNTLRARGKQVIVWGVRGSTSRVLENNPSIKLEYVDDFALFRRHNELVGIFDEEPQIEVEEEPIFRPSQWSSLVLQYDYLRVVSSRPITIETLSEQLDSVNVAANEDRAEDLIQQAIKTGILLVDESSGILSLDNSNSIVSKTHLIRDHILNRVSNTLAVRNWNYVNYGFLLKGLAMDEALTGGGINIDDNWRSEWIDFLVRENVLERELIPHRHNPDDLVPVISVSEHIARAEFEYAQEAQSEEAITEMSYRIVVSVEQFTSFRNFVWCPLGSLHKRLRPFDESTVFQRSVEMLQSDGAIHLAEYSNPQSDFLTKGVSLVKDSPIVLDILQQRDDFVLALLQLYEQRVPINQQSIQEASQFNDQQMIRLWISIMELENILNTVPGQGGHYSLFRTHHTVNIVADKYQK